MGSAPLTGFTGMHVYRGAHERRNQRDDGHVAPCGEWFSVHGGERSGGSGVCRATNRESDLGGSGKRKCVLGRTGERKCEKGERNCGGTGERKQSARPPPAQAPFFAPGIYTSSSLVVHTQRARTRMRAHKHFLCIRTHTLSLSAYALHDVH